MMQNMQRLVVNTENPVVDSIYILRLQCDAMYIHHLVHPKATM